MHRTLFRLIIIALFLFLTGEVIAKNDITRADQIPTLKEEAHQQTVSQRINAYFTLAHYRKFNLNEDFVIKIFNRYINMLDYSHNVLLASDIVPFVAKKSQLTNGFKRGNLDLFYAIYNLAGKRRFERYQYALTQLANPMDFEGNDFIEINRSKAPWPKTVTDLNSIWDTQVKYDELNLKLSGKKNREIRDILTKRYQRAIQYQAQNNSEDVFQLIMNAFAHEIDPHTNYLPPRNTEQFNTELSLSLEGIGVILQMNDNYTVINSLVPDGPAAKTKAISVNDRVISVGQSDKPMTNVIGWRLVDVVSLIKGPQGSKVRLEILPAGKGVKPRIVTVMRERIRLKDRAVKISVKTIGKEKIGVLNISRFYIGLTDDVKVQLQKLKQQNLQSIIVDLRANGGGSLPEAVSLAGLFISSGPIVQVMDNNGKITEEDNTDGIAFYKGSLVVLVDRFSASASEIFAAAMQDYGRALVVGEPTFGKGTVQQYCSLNRIYDQILHPKWPVLGSIQYTIKKFYRVNGGSTQCQGVVPDIIWPTGINSVETGEKFEDNALPWDTTKPATYTKINNLKPFIASLLKAHQSRIANNSEFHHIQKDVDFFQATQYKHKWVSLNLTQREQENLEEKKIRLQRLNNRLIHQKKKLLKNLESISNNYKEPDIYLYEAVQIALDFTHIEVKKNLHRSSI
ncbi:MAG: carboxy terminal-processing peptidase [Sodalis sp. (in: enterobacteria)]